LLLCDGPNSAATRQGHRDPGSSTLTASLLQTGLLDELRIMVNPVILGQGRSLFAGTGKTSLKLMKTREFTSGNVLLYYQPITN
jgi:riboflavin biosynthesis pyrimidine reductase